jgi:transcriptional regulator with XRE-family HTH domain
MDFYILSDNAIEEELGRRFKALRLRKNITQKQLAEATTLSLNTIKALEAGSGKLSSVIAVLRELGALDQLDHCIPDSTISPLQLAKMQGKQRERASGRRAKQRTRDDTEW